MFVSVFREGSMAVVDHLGVFLLAFHVDGDFTALCLLVLVLLAARDIDNIAENSWLSRPHLRPLIEHLTLLIDQEPLLCGIGGDSPRQESLNRCVGS